MWYVRPGTKNKRKSLVHKILPIMRSLGIFLGLIPEKKGCRYWEASTDSRDWIR